MALVLDATFFVHHLSRIVVAWTSATVEHAVTYGSFGLPSALVVGPVRPHFRCPEASSRPGAASLRSYGVAGFAPIATTLLLLWW